MFIQARTKLSPSLSDLNGRTVTATYLINTIRLNVRNTILVATQEKLQRERVVEGKTEAVQKEDALELTGNIT